VAQHPASEHIVRDRVAPPRLRKIFKNLRFAHRGIRFFEAGYDHAYICFAGSVEGEVVARGGESQDWTPAFRPDFHQPPIKPDSGDLPLNCPGQFLKGRDDDVARNASSILLADDIVELSISNEVHAGVSAGVRWRGANECNGATPRIGAVGEIELMSQLDLPVGARRGFVAATGIGARGACGRPPLMLCLATPTPSPIWSSWVPS
jgi:hypothetical protein